MIIDDISFNLAAASPKANMNLWWFLNKFPREDYKDRYVAIDNCQVVDSDTDIHKLLERLKQTPSMMVEYI